MTCDIVEFSNKHSTGSRFYARANQTCSINEEDDFDSFCQHLVRFYADGKGATPAIFASPATGAIVTTLGESSAIVEQCS